MTYWTRDITNNWSRLYYIRDPMSIVCGMILAEMFNRWDDDGLLDIVAGWIVVGVPVPDMIQGDCVDFHRGAWKYTCQPDRAGRWIIYCQSDAGEFAPIWVNNMPEPLIQMILG